MKKFTLSVVAVMAMSTFAIAGGDIAPVEPVVEEVVAPVVDDSSFYVGIGYSYMDLNVDFTNDWEANIDGDAVTILAGYNFNKYFALEGRYSTTFGDLDVEFSDGRVTDTAEVDAEMSNIALYLKPMYPIGGLTLYGLLGYGQVSMEIAEFSDDASESSFQWGLGASYAVNDNFGIFVDYTRLYDDTGFDDWGDEEDVLLDAISVGVTYKF